MRKGTRISTPDGVGVLIRESPITGVLEVRLGIISAWYSPWECFEVGQHTQRTQQAELFL